MAASILKGALPKSIEGSQAATELIASNEDQYEEFAVRLASGLIYDKTGLGSGRLIELRKLLYESRSTSALFDTKRWVSDLEYAYVEAWRRWVEGIGGDIYL
jgi:predicted O-linked N-acetylglucosamine transferase (SPINDLY family)